MFCPKCGTKNVDGAKFCRGCGAPLAAAPAAPVAGGSAAAPAATAIKPKRKKAPFIVGAIVAVVAVALLAVFVVVPAMDKSPFKDAKVGDIVQFGSYEQDGDESNGKEAIDWRVLAVDGKRAYVVSEKALDAHAFNFDSDKGNDWDSSDLKAWLEGDFASEAFSDSDKKVINGEPTLLSVDEANQYFQSDDDRICYPTQQALNDGAWTWGQISTSWWLRSPGDHSYDAAVVFGDGTVNSGGIGVSSSSGCSVRPALWVNL